MTIETKYDIGKDVYCFDTETKIIEGGTIEDITIFKNNGVLQALYKVDIRGNNRKDHLYVSDNQIFKTITDAYEYIKEHIREIISPRVTIRD